MSALTGKGAQGLMPAALTMYERWNQRVPTSKLNRWLEKVGWGWGVYCWRQWQWAEVASLFLAGWLCGWLCGGGGVVCLQAAF